MKNDKLNTSNAGVTAVAKNVENAASTNVLLTSTQPGLINVFHTGKDGQAKSIFSIDANELLAQGGKWSVRFPIGGKYGYESGSIITFIATDYEYKYLFAVHSLRIDDDAKVSHVKTIYDQFTMRDFNSDDIPSIEGADKPSDECIDGDITNILLEPQFTDILPSMGYDMEVLNKHFFTVKLLKLQPEQHDLLAFEYHLSKLTKMEKANTALARVSGDVSAEAHDLQGYFNQNLKPLISSWIKQDPSINEVMDPKVASYLAANSSSEKKSRTSAKSKARDSEDA